MRLTIQCDGDHVSAYNLCVRASRDRFYGDRVTSLSRSRHVENLAEIWEVKYLCILIIVISFLRSASGLSTH